MPIGLSAPLVAVAIVVAILAILGVRDILASLRERKRLFRILEESLKGDSRWSRYPEDSIFVRHSSGLAICVNLFSMQRMSGRDGEPIEELPNSLRKVIEDRFGHFEKGHQDVVPQQQRLADFCEKALKRQ